MEKNPVESTSCIFCKIASHEVETKIIFEDDLVVAFKAQNQIAPVHILVVPRKHYTNLNGLTQADEATYGRIVRVASELAAQKKIEDGWQLFVRVGKGGGQEVMHVHFHLVSGQHV
jgi:histidine triad (HIT) family protein